MISAAFSVASRKGAYALLLASGVSRSAEIPTGWEIVKDLIFRVAKLSGKDCGADPVAWFRTEYGKEPDYSDLLSALAKSPEDRQSILKGHFEPTEDERSRGVKMPQAAHKAIAELVCAGYVRVIVTTNFDRLLEHALQERGVAVTVISTPDQADGALPLVHSGCVVIKINGDYLDPRIKNTTTELATYDERISRLLDRIFDEYGLIVCGWSATWDIGLCACLERCKSHRFTTFWCKRGILEDAAKRMIAVRQAEVIEVRDADSFFQDLAGKVQAIEEFDRPHPMSAKLATEMLKRYLVDERSKIKLHDLVTLETEKACVRLQDRNFPAEVPANEETFVKRVRHFEAITEVLLALVATGCFWGTREQASLFAKSLERVGNAISFQQGTPLWNELRLYPALLIMYAGGLAAVAHETYSTLSTFLIQPRYKGLDSNGERPLIQFVTPQRVIRNSALGNLLLRVDGRGRLRPVSEYLYHFLRPALRDFVPSDSDYDEVFDRFEYLFAVLYVDQNLNAAVVPWIPLGRFTARYSLLSESSEPISRRIAAEIEKEGENWPPLRAGLFGGSVERFSIAKGRVDSYIAQSANWR